MLLTRVLLLVLLVVVSCGASSKKHEGEATVIADNVVNFIFDGLIPASPSCSCPSPSPCPTFNLTEERTCSLFFSFLGLNLSLLSSGETRREADRGRSARPQRTGFWYHRQQYRSAPLGGTHCQPVALTRCRFTQTRRHHSLAAEHRFVFVFRGRGGEAIKLSG